MNKEQRFILTHGFGGWKVQDMVITSDEGHLLLHHIVEKK
jgi:hypothetical protein